MDKLRDYMDFWRASLTASTQEEERLDNAIALIQQAEEEQRNEVKCVECAIYADDLISLQKQAEKVVDKYFDKSFCNAPEFYSDMKTLRKMVK